MARRKHILLKNGSEIFLAQGLDSRIGVERLHEFRFFAHAAAGIGKGAGDGKAQAGCVASGKSLDTNGALPCAKRKQTRAGLATAVTRRRLTRP
jgi:hypothetical protein